MSARGFDVYLTADVEPDCPPYLWTWRGIEEGMPRLLDLFSDEAVSGTFFVTGDTAQRYPQVVDAILRQGLELGCHGFSHEGFDTFDEARAQGEITHTNAILRAHGPVTSFRAPYLRFPERFVPLLAADGMTHDASRARYKRKEPRHPGFPAMRRLEASVPTSLTRLPSLLRTPMLMALKRPIVLFVHPWEFIDLTKTAIPFDCRYRTGKPALDDLRAVIRTLRAAGARFRQVRDFEG